MIAILGCFLSQAICVVFLLLMFTLVFAQIDATQTPFQVGNDFTEDQSASLQAALNDAQKGPRREYLDWPRKSQHYLLRQCYAKTIKKEQEK